MNHLSYIKDAYALEAKRKGYRSRAALKILQLHEQYNIFKPGQTILDLGAAPGGWSQVAHNIVGHTGKVIGIDLLPIEPYSNIQFIQGNFHTDLPDIHYDVVLSDACANKTGNRFVDQIRMFDLASEIVILASSLLSPFGIFVCKFFHGEQEKAFDTLLSDHFTSSKKTKPAASRAISGEFYYLCRK